MKMRSRTKVFRQCLSFVLLVLSLLVFTDRGYAEGERGRITLRDGARIYYEAAGEDRHNQR